MEINDKSKQSYIEAYFSPYRLLIVVVSVLGVIGWYIHPLIIENEWCFGPCTHQIDIGLLLPLRNILLGIASVFAIFLLLPIRYFRRWFIYFARWIIPIGLLFIFTLPIQSGGFLSYQERVLGSILLPIYFFIGTSILIVMFILYDIWQWYLVKRRTRP